jgi:hypothetical protein
MSGRQVLPQLAERLGVLLSAKQRRVADDVGMNAGNHQRQAAGGRGGIEGAAHHVAECLALAAQQRDRAHRHANVLLANSRHVAGYRVCAAGACRPLGHRGEALVLSSCKGAMR